MKREINNWLLRNWMIYKNPKCTECKGDGIIHFDGEDFWDKCEHCKGEGYIDKGGKPFLRNFNIITP